MNFEPLSDYIQRAKALHEEREQHPQGSQEWLRLTEQIAELFHTRGRSETWRDHRAAAANDGGELE